MATDDVLQTEREDEAQEARADEVARLFGTTPNSLSGVTDRTRRHAERTEQDASARGWMPLGPRNVGGAIRCLAIRTPTAAERQQRLPVHMVAGSAQGGLWMSENEGYSWRPAGLPDIVGAVGAVAWSTHDRRVLYVGTGDVPLSYPGGSGLYKSEDGGGTFKRLVEASGGDDGAARNYPKIAIDAQDANRAWVASSTGLWRLRGSRFDAETIPGVPAGTAVTDVALADDPADRNRCFVLAGIQGLGVAVGTYDRRRNNMAWQVTTGAGPWPAIGVVRVAWGSVAPVPVAHAIMSDATMAGAPPAASNRATPLFSSTNLGATWSAVAGAVSPEPTRRIAWYALTLAVHPTTPALVVVGSTDLYRTADGGVTWVRVMDWTQYYRGDHAQHADHFALVFDGPAGARLWACNDGGISTTDNLGVAAVAAVAPAGPTAPVVWRKRSYGISAAQLFDLTTHPRYPSVFGGGMQDNGTFLSFGGTSWYSIDGGDGGSMAFHPTSPYRCYTSTQESVSRVDVSTFVGPTLHTARLPDVSAPNNTFAPYRERFPIVPPGRFFLRAIAAHPTTPDLVLIGTRDALQYTSDGRTIATARTALAAPPPNRDFTTVAFSPSGADMWGGTSQGDVLLNSAPLPPSGGAGAQPAWARVATLGAAITAIAAHPADARVVAVATAITGTAGQLMLSHDRGAHWDPIDAAPNGLPASPYLSLAWDPGNMGTLFVGTASGVYVTRSLPAVGSLVPGSVPAPTWRTFNRGLPLVPVTDLEVHSITRTLRCATLGRGAYEVTLAGTTPAAFVIPDVLLLIRSHAADDGRSYPAVSTLGGDPRLGIAPEPPIGLVVAAPAANPAGPIDVTHAIDIRVDSPRFTRSEAFAFGDPIDGAEFDETLRPDRPLVGDQNIVYVQVQNRGASVATNVNVHLYFADAGAPVAIPAIDGAFNFPDQPGAASPWQRADVLTVGEVVPGHPSVVGFRVIPPLKIRANIVFLALVTGTQDAMANVPAGDAVAFVRGERRAALHVSAVERDTIMIRDGVDDRGDRGGVAWGGRSPDIIVRQAQVAPAAFAAEFADLAEGHGANAAHLGANFVYVRVTNRTQSEVPRSVVRLFRVVRPALGVPGPDGANWKEVTPVQVLTAIPAGGWAVAEFSMPLPVAPETDPDPFNANDAKGIILVAMANVTDAAGAELDPFPDFASVTDVASFWRFFNGGALANNVAMRALRYVP